MVKVQYLEEMLTASTSSFGVPLSKHTQECLHLWAISYWGGTTPSPSLYKHKQFSLIQLNQGNSHRTQRGRSWVPMHTEIGMWVSVCTHTAEACHILLWPLLLIYYYFFPFSFTNHCLIGEAVCGSFSSVTTPQKKKKKKISKTVTPKMGKCVCTKIISGALTQPFNRQKSCSFRNRLLRWG